MGRDRRVLKISKSADVIQTLKREAEAIEGARKGVIKAIRIPIRALRTTEEDILGLRQIAERLLKVGKDFEGKPLTKIQKEQLRKIINVD